MVRLSFAIAALVGSAPSCPDLYSIGAHGFAVPTISARGGSGTTEASGLRVQVDFAAHNPNAFPISLSGVDYDLSIEGEPAFSGSQAGVSVAENADGTVALRGLLSRTSPAFQGLRPGATAHYLLSGTVHVDTPAGVPVDVEFSTPGVFVVPSTFPAGR